MRAVEIVPDGVPSEMLNCRTGRSTGRCGADAEAAFREARAHAVDLLNTTVGALPAKPTSQVATLLDRFFGAGVAGAGLAHRGTVRTNLRLLQAQIGRLARPRAHVCSNECDAVCRIAIAYNEDAGDAARLTICQGYPQRPTEERVRNLLHEAAHATAGLGRAGRREGTTDVAYRYERQFDFLAPADALRNSDSYALFVMVASEPGFVPFRPPPDDMQSLTQPQQDVVRPALGLMEKWLNWSEVDTAALYRTIHRSRPPATAWEHPYFEETMRLVAPRFGLTDPPALPTMRDQIAVAGIRDRYSRMLRALHQQLTIKSAAAGATTWAAGPGAEVTVAPDFFAPALATAEDRARLLLVALVSSTPGIDAALRPSYVELANEIRIRRQR